MTLEKVNVVRDEDGHWFIIPSEKEDEFYEDLEDYGFIDTGGFDIKWSRYKTGGDINLVQLWAELKK